MLKMLKYKVKQSRCTFSTRTDIWYVHWKVIVRTQEGFTLYSHHQYAYYFISYVSPDQTLPLVRTVS